jgi:heme/copper-type cytochrome/quinol oxidase subunit 2
MGGRAGKTRNIFLVWLVWPLITLGIYYYVWWYKINREARDFDPEIKVEPVLSLLAVTIGWFIIVPPFVSTWRAGERIAQMQRTAGLEPTCQPWIGFVLMFVFSLQSLYLQSELNKIWAHLGYPAEGTQVMPAATAQA